MEPLVELTLGQHYLEKLHLAYLGIVEEAYLGIVEEAYLGIVN